MKTKEELNALKEEVETLNKKLHELTDEELEQVTGGEYPIVTELTDDLIESGEFLVPGECFSYNKETYSYVREFAGMRVYKTTAGKTMFVPKNNVFMT